MIFKLSFTLFIFFMVCIGDVGVIPPMADVPAKSPPLDFMDEITIRNLLF